MCRTSLMRAVVVAVALFPLERASEAGVVLGQEPGHFAFFDSVDRSLKTLLDDFIIQTSTDLLSDLLPSSRAPLRVTPEQEKAFRGAADTLDEFLSGWRQSESLTPEQKKALEDATRVINEMSSSPANEPVYIPERSPPVPEPILSPPIETKASGTTGKFGPFYYALPEGWTTETRYSSSNGVTSLRVSKGGQWFTLSNIPNVPGTPRDPAGFMRMIHSIPQPPGDAMGNTTVGKQKIPAVWGLRDGENDFAFAYGGTTYFSAFGGSTPEARRARDEFLASLDLEKPLPESSPPRPEYIPPPVHQEAEPSSDFLTERGKDFFTALAQLASESGAHNLAVSSDLMKLCLEYPDLRDSALEAWETTLLALQGGSFEDMDRALLQFEYDIAGTVGGMVGAKAGAPFGPTPAGATVAVLSARGTTWVFEKYIDAFHWWTDEWGKLGEAVVPLYLQGFERYTDFWGQQGEDFGTWVRSW